MANNLTNSKLHLGYLDGLRALAAIYVVVHHSFHHLETIPNAGRVTQAVAGIFSYGHFAVDVFIVLSGFCLMIPVTRSALHVQGGALHFFAKRARRILPPYYLAMGLSLALIATLVGTRTGTHWDVSIPVRPLDIVTHLLLVQDAGQITASRINHTFWSISVEWRIYFLFPVLVVCWRKIGPARTMLLAAGASVVGLIALLEIRRFYPDVNLGICPHYLLLFAAGMLAADIAFNNRQLPVFRGKFFWAAWLGGATAMLLALMVGDRLLGRRIPWILQDFPVGFWAFCLLVYVAKPTDGDPGAKLFRSALSWSPLAFAGTFAYSIYLVHAPLLQVIWQYALVPMRLAPVTAIWVLVLLGTPTILAAAYLFFLLCEKPFVFSRRKSAVTPAAREIVEVNDLGPASSSPSSLQPSAKP